MNERALLLLAEESVRLAWLGAIFLSLSSFPAAVSALRRMGWRSYLPWILVTVLAVSLRLMVDPSLVHENRHGEMMYLRLLQGGHFLHGAAWFETHRPLVAFRPLLDTVFTAGALVGGLSCVFTGLFAMVVTRARPGEALLAAFILALLPVHIRVSASESPLVLGAFLTVASATAVAHGLRSRRYTLIWAGLLLAVVLGQTRPIYMVYPAFLLAIAWVVRRPKGEGRAWLFHLLGAAGLCALLLVPRILTILLLASEGDAVSGISLHTLRNHLFSEAHIVLNPRLFPITLTLLGLGGMGLLTFRETRSAIWIGALLCLLTCWFLTMQPNLGAILRFQHSFLFLWAVLAARGAASLLSIPAGTPIRAAASVMVLLAVIVSALPGARIIDHHFDKDLELDWLRKEARAALPQRGTLVIPGDRAFAEGRILLYFLPEVLPNEGRGWTIVRQLPSGPVHPALLSTDDEVFYYRGLWAYEFSSDELPERKAPASGTDKYRANPFFDHERTSPGVTVWTGAEEVMVRPEIVELEARLLLAEVPGLAPFSFETRPYHRWIVPQKEPVLSFHRVLAVDGERLDR